MREQGAADGLAVGASVVSGPVRLTKDAAIAFAAEYDPQPMHIDAEAARTGFFKGLVASGWHVLALTMRLAVEAKPLGERPLIGAEIESIRFRRPVSPEAVLLVRITRDAADQQIGANSFARLTVETLDAPSGEVLVRQRWRMLLVDAPPALRSASP